MITKDDLVMLTGLAEKSIISVGERYSFKIKYRFQVLVPKRQILHLCSNAVFRSALT